MTSLLNSTVDLKMMREIQHLFNLKGFSFCTIKKPLVSYCEPSVSPISTTSI